MSPEDLPLYRCHKQVRAMKIGYVLEVKEFAKVAPTVLLAPEGPVSRERCLEVPYEWAQRHKPDVGGYVVVYDDGYLSFSPAKPFEDGYSLVQPQSGTQQAQLEELAHRERDLSR